MNGGKEDYRRYNVLSTKYNVPSIRGGIRDSGALRIPTSYLNILRSIFNISLVFVSRISYFVLGTLYLVHGTTKKPFEVNRRA